MHFVAAALGDVNAKEPVRAGSYPCSKLTRLLETTMSPKCYHSCVAKALVQSPALGFRRMRGCAVRVLGEDSLILHVPRDSIL